MNSEKTASVKEPANKTPYLLGMTSIRSDIPTKNYEIGMKALELRLYSEAGHRLEQSWLEFRKTGKNKHLELLSRLGLSEVYLAEDKSAKALPLLQSIRQEFNRQFGSQSYEAGRMIYDLALAEFAEANLEKSKLLAEESLAIRQKLLGSEHHDTGITHCLIGRIQYAQGMYEEASESFKKALTVLEVHSGFEQLDYADALSGLAQVKQKLGDEEESVKLTENALTLRGIAVRLDKTPSRKGLVKYTWQDGMQGCRQVTDPVYPLKYTVINGLRVACTVVRSDKHMVVLISLANCSRRPIQLAVGPVSMERIKPSRQPLVFCDPAYMDITLEESRVTDFTWRRRWLCHITKTRRIPGYLKNGELDPENFFGNNIFGLYGNWDISLIDAPPVVTREQFVFDQKALPYDVDLLGFMRGSSSDIRPTLIEPGDARTGLVFFLRQHYETAKVRLTVGNAQIDFPFQAAPGQ